MNNISKDTKKSILELENINKIYQGKTETLHILRDLNLTIKEGEFVAIMGKSGSGKSTMLNLIGLLDKPTEGTIIIDGIDVSKSKDRDKDEIKNQKLGFVFQFHYLLSEFNALENVMLPALATKKIDKKAAEAKALELLKEVGLEDRIYHKPSELSGGEKQRVAIARAMVNSPAIILADEPTGNLDEETSETIHNLFKEINKKKNQTIIVVTHSKELAGITDKKLLLKKGKIETQENNLL